jgi:hypothetical protein
LHTKCPLIGQKTVSNLGTIVELPPLHDKGFVGCVAVKHKGYPAGVSGRRRSRHDSIDGQRSLEVLMSLTLRRANAEDAEFAFRVLKETMREYVEANHFTARSSALLRRRCWGLRAPAAFL